MSIPIVLIQGANMEALGTRQPEFYGTTTAAELDAMVTAEAEALGATLDITYTNHEGAAMDRIYQAARDGAAGLLMNPAGFSYGGRALADCVRAVSLPYVEVHMTNIEVRGIVSVTAPAADAVVAGLGTFSYIAGLRGLLAIVAGSERPGATKGRP